MQDSISKRGSKRLSEDDENVMFWFLTSENGTPMSGSWVKSVRATARSIWAYLHSQHAAPLTWSEATSLTRAYYAEEMERVYPELRLCEFSSKAHRLATLGYSGWAKSHFSKHGSPPGVLVKIDPNTMESDAAAVVAGKRKASEYPSDAPRPKKTKQKTPKIKLTTEPNPTAAAMSPPPLPPTHAQSPPPLPPTQAQEPLPHSPLTLLVDTAQTQLPLPLPSSETPPTTIPAVEPAPPQSPEPLTNPPATPLPLLQLATAPPAHVPVPITTGSQVWQPYPATAAYKANNTRFRSTTPCKCFVTDPISIEPQFLCYSASLGEPIVPVARAEFVESQNKASGSRGKSPSTIFSNA